LVRWVKGLEPDEVEPLIESLPGEIVIHFRWASVGEVTPKLCHPFPVTPSATTRLNGTARAVLFHNGTYGAWRDVLRKMPKGRIGDKLLSDSRVVASMIDYLGIDVLDEINGKFVVFERDFTKLFGYWENFGGMKASNLYFAESVRTIALEQSTLTFDEE
jgi:predicted glutamine amidotransferase